MSTATDTPSVTPTKGYVLVKPLETMVGTLLLSDNAKYKPQRGEVISIGESPASNEYGTSYHCPVKVSDKVFFKNWGTELFNVKGIDYVFVRFQDIVGIIHE